MANALLAAALEYASNGWPVFPCKRDKTPLTSNGVKDATTDPQRIRNWWAEHPQANISVHVGEAGFIVLDYDPGSKKREVRAMVPDLQPTGLVSATPRGGLHEWYQLQPHHPRVANSASKVAPKVDVRSHNGYVLVPPSQTDAGDYTWLSEEEPAVATDSLVWTASVAKEKHEEAQVWIIEPDLEHNVATAVDWLVNTAVPSIEGQGGNDKLYAAACYIRDLGISEDKAIELTLAHYNPRCVPPWSEEQSDHFVATVQHAYVYGQHQPGYRTAEYNVAKIREKLKPVEHDETCLHFSVAHITFRGSIARRHMPAVEWLIEDTLPRQGNAILFGARETYKTFVALDMAMSVATGNTEAWLVEHTGPVIYFAGEGVRGFSIREQGWLRVRHNAVALPDTQLVLADATPLLSHSEAEALVFIESLKAIHDEWALAVIDTTGRALAGLNENQMEHASKYSWLAKQFQKLLGSTVLGIAHSGVEAGERVRGSSVFEADADTVIQASRPFNMKNKVRLKMTKQKDTDHWKSDRYYDLIENGTPDERTLVPKSGDAPAKPRTGAAGELRAIDDAALHAIVNNPGIVFSNKKLAELLVSRAYPDVQFELTAMQKKLRELQGHMEAKSSVYWDALGGDTTGRKGGNWNVKNGPRVSPDTGNVTKSEQSSSVAEVTDL